ncbi:MULTISPECIES: lipoprotein [Stappiaceae]|uniref:Type IV secretion system putative lipoprotein virB7 n=1 Tax=Roseibium aggregatum TaxID=187304 RepID=A0A0M6Y0N2_9HYPH|nr:MULTISPECIES: lipoprotein [Stappiaceae]MEC9404425.1 lipoprotein [Pseudomonadota bacterium]MEC9417728.1 lipoprotein [Pseudomonadota bacterium]MEC9472967.1 lipoprotein [Pseudomonadota bacterium]NKI57113.1 lipoprotein [Labrenzia sp. PO1]NKX65834.1 lipoprotein [Labrenzia sp. 5N]
MKKILLVALAATALAGCQSSSQRDRALVGGGLGAATGAIVGAAAGAGAAPVLAGAAIGAAGGAVIGAATTPKNCVAHDRYGNPYRVACP